MSRIEWADPEKKLIMWSIAAGGTVDDLLVAFRQYRDMAMSVENPIYVIIDFTAVIEIPPDIISRFSEIGQLLPEKRAIAVAIVSHKRAVTTMLNMFSRIYQTPFMFFLTLEEARDFINDLMDVSPNQ